MFALCDWLSAHGTSCAELVGFIAGVLNVWLVTRENIWSWPVGIINAAFYIVVFARDGLYSDTGLQGVYLLLSIYGWWQWHQGTPARQDAAARTPLVVTRVRASLVLPLVGIAVVLWLGLAAITSRIPNSTLPWFDAALVASSLVAQWMMTKKLRECWWVWIVVDAAYVGLFIIRGLHLTAVLYFIFFLLAILGLVQWTRSAQRSIPQHSPASS